MVCAVQADGRSNRSTANTSTILTAHCRNRRAVAPFGPVRPASRRRKLLITGTASHLNHVPDTTCHIGGRPGPAGMRVAYITGKRGDVALGKEASKADSNKAWVWNEAEMPVGYHVVPDKNKNTPPHTSRRQMTPRQAGFFLPWAGARPGRPSKGRLPWGNPHQVAGAVLFTVSVKVAACITDPDVAVTVTVVAAGDVAVPEAPRSPMEKQRATEFQRSSRLVWYQSTVVPYAV
jgi:hypothetical protein